MSVKYTAKQARQLLKDAVGKDSNADLESASKGGPSVNGACIIVRPGRGTKDVCKVLTEAECRWVDTQLQANIAGHADFFPGKACV
ncbi:hypothetical protein LJR231_000498 [Phyllobacterium sp. LjRoot231]|uniref:hypothetical protein n=1 Tax=Phyllobacterium sp. LjRoot231 TaxID=3342289 RepID=UPI003ECFF5D7